MIHGFREKLAQGKLGEARLDGYFQGLFEISPASDNMERRGIDRIFQPFWDDRSFPVEYKTDLEADNTDNLFIEIASVVVNGVVVKLGWAHTSEATIFAFYLPQTGRVFWVKVARLRAALPFWRTLYPEMPAYNEGYHSIGLLVPVQVVAAIAEREFFIKAAADVN